MYTDRLPAGTLCGPWGVMNPASSLRFCKNGWARTR